MFRSHLRCRSVGLVGLAAAAALAFSFVGGAAAGVRAPARSNALPTLNLGIGQYYSGYTDVFVAEYEGFFKKAGVNVSLTNVGTQLLPYYLAGRVDMMIGGPTSQDAAAVQGKDTRLIYAHEFGQRTGFPVKQDSSAQSAMDLSGGTCAQFGPGLSTGACLSLSQYLQAHGGKALNVIALQTATGDYAAPVAGGTVDTASMSQSIAQPYILAGKLRYLKDLAPGSALMAQLVPPYLVGVGTWVLNDTLNAKHDAFVRYIAGLRMAQRWMAAHSDKTIAYLLANAVQGFNQLPLPTVAGAVTQSRFTWSLKQGGYVPASNWTKTFALFQGWGFPVDFTQPVFSYSARVDMAPWNAATKIVNKLYPLKKK